MVQTKINSLKEINEAVNRNYEGTIFSLVFFISFMVLSFIDPILLPILIFFGVMVIVAVINNRYWSLVERLDKK